MWWMNHEWMYNCVSLYVINKHRANKPLNFIDNVKYPYKEIKFNWKPFLTYKV